MSKRIGVILSGCGVQDGSEIHEATLCLLYLAEAGVEAVCYAPNVNQARTINHFSGEIMAEHRNVLVESARIARGVVTDLQKFQSQDIDGLALPGGYGAALNLSKFGAMGAKGEVQVDVRRAIEDTYAASKPIAAACIAPATVALVLGRYGVRLTIGNDPDTARAIECTGAVHVSCPVTDVVLDQRNKLVTTPAYMLGPDIAQVARGIQRMVKALVEMA